jgi:hypothetical protein
MDHVMTFLSFVCTTKSHQMLKLYASWTEKGTKWSIVAYFIVLIQWRS